MGFIISEKGFEMTPGSREVNTPGIWRQDSAMPSAGDAFSSAFATAYSSVEPITPEERAENKQKRIIRKQNRTQKQADKLHKASLSGNTKKAGRIANRLKKTNTKIAKKTKKLQKFKSKHKIK